LRVLGGEGSPLTLGYTQKLSPRPENYSTTPITTNKTGAVNVTQEIKIESILCIVRDIRKMVKILSTWSVIVPHSFFFEFWADIFRPKRLKTGLPTHSYAENRKKIRVFSYLVKNAA